MPKKASGAGTCSKKATPETAPKVSRPTQNGNTSSNAHN